jgi:hypothetical protein
MEPIDLNIKRSLLELIISGLTYSSIIVIIDFLIILLLTQEQNQIVSYLSLVMLAEGGLGLIAGGAVASFRGLSNKFGEIILNSEPWDFKKQKKAEKQAQILIVTGCIIAFFGLLTSAI